MLPDLSIEIVDFLREEPVGRGANSEVPPPPTAFSLLCFPFLCPSIPPKHLSYVLTPYLTSSPEGIGVGIAQLSIRPARGISVPAFSSYGVVQRQELNSKPLLEGANDILLNDRAGQGDVRHNP